MGYTIGYLFERAFSIFPSWFFFSGECIEIFDLLAIFQLKNGRKVFFGFVIIFLGGARVFKVLEQDDEKARRQDRKRQKKTEKRQKKDRKRQEQTGK